VVLAYEEEATSARRAYLVVGREEEITGAL